MEEKTRHPDGNVEDDAGDERVAFVVLDAEPLELCVVILIKANEQRVVEEKEPHVASRAIENASELGLFARHASQLSVCAVVEIRTSQQ